MLCVTVFAFFHFEAGEPTEFVGLANFGRLLADRWFTSSVILTGTFVSIATLVEVSLGLLIALALDACPKAKGLFRPLLALPLLLSPVVVGIVWRHALNEQSGFGANALQALFGAGARPLSSPAGAFLSILSVDVWQWAPLAALLISLSLDSAREKLDDLVCVDRVTKTQALWNIWMPQIWPLIALVALIRAVDALRTFDVIQVLTAGGPGAATELLSLFVYKQVIKFGNFGYAAAGALALLLTSSLLLFVATRWIGRSWKQRSSP